MRHWFRILCRVHKKEQYMPLCAEKSVYERNVCIKIFAWFCGRWIALSTPGDLTVSKRPGTSYQIKIHFSIKTTNFLMNYNLLSFQIFDRLIISFTKYYYQVSTSFMQEKKRYKGLKTGKWISIWSLVPGLLLTVRSASWIVICQLPHKGIKSMTTGILNLQRIKTYKYWTLIWVFPITLILKFSEFKSLSVKNTSTDWRQPPYILSSLRCYPMRMTLFHKFVHKWT